MTGRAARAALTVAALAAAAAGCAAPRSSAPAARAPAAAAPRASAPARTTASCNPDASSLAPSGGASASPGSWAATIKARGKLIVGVDQSTYHFGFLNPIDNKIEGFDIDMVDAVAHAIFGPDITGRIEFKAISDADRVPDLRNGTVDLVAHTMTITCQRLRQVDFSSVYYNAKAQLLVLKSSPAARPAYANDVPAAMATLKGKPVCATTGSDDLDVIRAHGADPVAVTYWTDCLVDLQQGQVAGIVTDDSILAGLKAQDPFATVVGGRASSLEAEPYGLGVSKAHPDFVRFVNAVLAHVESDGQWEQDYRQWVGGPAQPPPTPQYAG
ncbi:MAG: glutamate ABC transporter substrate-binding protein [Streptosporangiales bacterium]|nr:glutamate ABC transporter substrate-binding protein [Streptosporangiales bacterium]